MACSECGFDSRRLHGGQHAPQAREAEGGSRGLRDVQASETIGRERVKAAKASDQRRMQAAADGPRARYRDV